MLVLYLFQSLKGLNTWKISPLQCFSLFLWQVLSFFSFLRLRCRMCAFQRAALQIRLQSPLQLLLECLTRGKPSFSSATSCRNVKVANCTKLRTTPSRTLCLAAVMVKQRAVQAISVKRATQRCITVRMVLYCLNLPNVQSSASSHLCHRDTDIMRGYFFRLYIKQRSSCTMRNEEWGLIYFLPFVCTVIANGGIENIPPKSQKTLPAFVFRGMLVERKCFICWTCRCWWLVCSINHAQHIFLTETSGHILATSD